MIDWLVASAAASPDHQKALIDNFLERYQKTNDPYQKEKRGLAMHVMYRSISEGHWFAEHGKAAKAENLVKLASQIINGEGIWQGVNTDIKLTKK